MYLLRVQVSCSFCEPSVGLQGGVGHCGALLLGCSQRPPLSASTHKNNSHRSHSGVCRSSSYPILFLLSSQVFIRGEGESSCFAQSKQRAITLLVCWRRRLLFRSVVTLHSRRIAFDCRVRTAALMRSAGTNDRDASYYGVGGGLMG